MNVWDRKIFFFFFDFSSKIHWLKGCHKTGKTSSRHRKGLFRRNLSVRSSETLSQLERSRSRLRRCNQAHLFDVEEDGQGPEILKR
jgi:hypothetical protein